MSTPPRRVRDPQARPFRAEKLTPVFASYRLEQIAADRVARALSAWSVSSSMTIAALTALWGLLANATSPRTAIAVAGVLILATPLLLPRRARTLGEQEQERELVASV